MRGLKRLLQASLVVLCALNFGICRDTIIMLDEYGKALDESNKQETEKEKHCKISVDKYLNLAWSRLYAFEPYIEVKKVLDEIEPLIKQLEAKYAK